MDIRITPAPLGGRVAAIASKSMAHRLLILAALSSGTCDINCNASSEDIEATIRCIEALGGTVAPTRLGFRVTPIPSAGEPGCPLGPILDCGESGSTLRFMLPVACALGANARFVVRGRLAERPLSPLYERISSHGCTLSPQGTWPLETSGQLCTGRYVLPGNVSSQYISGLLLAASVLKGTTQILVREPVQSAPYVTLTINALNSFGVRVDKGREYVGDAWHASYVLDPSASSRPKAHVVDVEGDWSNAAFWLAAGALDERPVTVTGLNLASAQGDRAILAALALFGAQIARSSTEITVRSAPLRPVELDVSDIPDLVPPLVAVAARAAGTTRLKNAGRLRLKESDRLATTSAAVCALGGDAWVEGDDLFVRGASRLAGGTVDAAGDHRIAMLGALLATHARQPSTILGAHCVSKSYPRFFEDFASLGGICNVQEASRPTRKEEA